MDYLFVPGGSTAEVLGRQVLSRRPNTLLITPPPAQNHVAGLLARLTALPPSAGNPTPRPIGDILLVAHGLETGNYFIPLSRALPSPADFEKADDADASASNPVRLTAALLTPPGGGGMNTITVRLRGCNIGRARPFIEKLRSAMTPAGGTVNVTAPLHFDEFHGIRGGHVEYLAHKFTLRVPAPFLRPDRSADRPALLAAFHAAGFTYLDGTAIPAVAWDGWVPRNIHPPPAQWKQSFDTDVELSPAVGGQTKVTIHREYRYETIPFSWDWGAPDPGNHPDRLDILRNTLPLGTIPPSGKHLYDPSYPWPLYERYGFVDIDDMVDHLDWRVTSSGGRLHFRATQFQYTVMLPITDPPAATVPPAPPATPVLKLYNFFPSSAAGGPAVLGLDETNARLFLIL
jgi:hypothetical protein